MVSIERAAGETSAAPSPCSERNAISEPSDQASPSSSELTVKRSDPGDEEPAASEQVGEPAAEQEHAAEEDRVGGDHPLQVLLAEVEVGLDRRKRDVHDRHVQDDHELGRRRSMPGRTTVSACRIESSVAPIVEDVHDNTQQRSAALLLFAMSTAPGPARARPSSPRSSWGAPLFLLARAGLRAQGAAGRGVRAGGLQHLPVRRARDPRRGGVRNPGDDRRRAPPRPQPARRRARRARGARA